MSEINRNSEGIRFEGHIGTWYTIDSIDAVYQGERGALAVDGSILEYDKGDQVELFLMEHEKYGDEAAHLIVTARGQIIDEECCDPIDEYISSTLTDWALFGAE